MMLQLTLTGKGDAEEINRLCGRLHELLEPADRRELEREMAVHKATLMLSKLREMGYVT